jgi:hypothetical protein
VDAIQTKQLADDQLEAFDAVADISHVLRKL